MIGPYFVEGVKHRRRRQPSGVAGSAHLRQHGNVAELRVGPRIGLAALDGQGALPVPRNSTRPSTSSGIHRGGWRVYQVTSATPASSAAICAAELAAELTGVAEVPCDTP